MCQKKEKDERAAETSESLSEMKGAEDKGKPVEWTNTTENKEILLKEDEKRLAYAHHEARDLYGARDYSRTVSALLFSSLVFTLPIINSFFLSLSVCGNGPHFLTLAALHILSLRILDIVRSLLFQRSVNVTTYNSAHITMMKHLPGENA